MIVLDGLDGREPLDEPVVLLAQPEHERVLLAGALDPQHAVGAVLPLADHVRDHRRRILQVGDDADDGVAATLEERMHRRADVAEVARVHDDLDVLVFGGNRLQDGDRVVPGGVVDENVLVLILADPNHYLADLVIEVENILLLVVAGRHDGDRLLAHSDDTPEGLVQV